MFYYEIPWFYQDFKSENLYTTPVTRDHLSPPKNIRELSRMSG